MVAVVSSIGFEAGGSGCEASGESKLSSQGIVETLSRSSLGLAVDDRPVQPQRTVFTQNSSSPQLSARRTWRMSPDSPNPVSLCPADHDFERTTPTNSAVPGLDARSSGECQDTGLGESGDEDKERLELPASLQRVMGSEPRSAMIPQFILEVGFTNPQSL